MTIIRLLLAASLMIMLSSFPANATKRYKYLEWIPLNHVIVCGVSFPEKIDIERYAAIRDYYDPPNGVPTNRALAFVGFKYKDESSCILLEQETLVSHVREIGILRDAHGRLRIVHRNTLLSSVMLNGKVLWREGDEIAFATLVDTKDEKSILAEHPTFGYTKKTEEKPVNQGRDWSYDDPDAGNDAAEAEIMLASVPSEARKAQRILYESGYLTCHGDHRAERNIDGRWGPCTAEAFDRWKRDHSLRIGPVVINELTELDKFDFGRLSTKWTAVDILLYNDASGIPQYQVYGPVIGFTRAEATGQVSSACQAQRRRLRNASCSLGSTFLSIATIVCRGYKQGIERVASSTVGDRTEGVALEKARNQLYNYLTAVNAGSCRTWTASANDK